jgi:hypothetical protein
MCHTAFSVIPSAGDYLLNVSKAGYKTWEASVEVHSIVRDTTRY